MAGTKRRKIGPRRFGREVPEWVQRLLEHGVEPEKGTDASIAYFGWLFCDETVPGLPPAESPEGGRIQHRARGRPPASGRDLTEDT
jgi:hypothetical protein